jgi:hypothetical protein
MTDRHTVNKRYKKLLEKEKETKIDVLGIEMTERLCLFCEWSLLCYPQYGIPI